VDAGRLRVVGAYYELVSGRVIFSEPVTAEQAPTAQRMVVHWPGAADDHVSLTWPDAF